MIFIDEVIRDIDISLFEKRFEKRIEEIQTEENIRLDLEYVLRFIPPSERIRSKKIILENAEVIMDAVTEGWNISSSDYFRVGHIWRNHTDVYVGAMADLIEKDRIAERFWVYNVCSLNQEQILKIFAKKRKSKLTLLDAVGYLPVY